MRRRVVVLDEPQRKELTHVLRHDQKPYRREMAGAILKVADGQQIKAVAQHGLARSYSEETVRRWINRYEQEGLSGLQVRSGRGRKPVFSPCA